jgi:signal transduction histidine kinase
MEQKHSSHSLDVGSFLILEQLSCGVLVTDTLGQVIYSNRALWDLLPETLSENVPESLYSICADPQTAQALIDGERSSAELVLEDGRVIAVEVRAIEDKHLWHFTDLTDRKQGSRIDRKRALLLSIMQKVDAELSHIYDAEHVLSVALKAAVQLSEAESAFIGVVEAGRIRLEHTFGLYGGIHEIGADGGITGRVIRNQQPELVLDVRRDADYQPAIPSTRAQMVFPLRSHETLLGILNLETSEADAFTRQVFEFLQVLTGRVAAALENVRLHEISQAQLAELRELNQLKTDIIRVASHDIRSPLAVVNGYLEMLADDFAATMTDEHRFFFNSMFIAIRRMQRMATDILSLDRVQSLQNKPDTLICINDVVRTAVLNIREEAKKHGHTFQALIPDRRLMVYGFETDLIEAVDNLLNNAVKYTPDGGRIVLRLHGMHNNGRDWAVLEVEDSGIGIPPQHQPRLFQPFFRIKTQETSHVDGTGLGLYLVKKLVELHGGTVWFRSDAKHGSVFGFQIPLVSEEENETA